MQQSKKANLQVISNELIGDNTYKLVFKDQLQAKAGQFINIKLEHHYLRRPFSIAKIKEYSFEIIYKVKGFGTTELAQVKKGSYLDVLLPLGNGFTLVENKKVLLIGGGIGVPPLLQLYDELQDSNKLKLLVGLNNSKENIYSEYQPLITTLDGSAGYQGNVIDYLKNNNLDYDYIYACGPMAMLKALQNYLEVPGQISIEERMGCGFGACMGCSCQTKDKTTKRICVEGPVFALGELDLDEY